MVSKKTLENKEFLGYSPLRTEFSTFSKNGPKWHRKWTQDKSSFPVREEDIASGWRRADASWPKPTARSAGHRWTPRGLTAFCAGSTTSGGPSLQPPWIGPFTWGPWVFRSWWWWSPWSYGAEETDGGLQPFSSLAPGGYSFYRWSSSSP